MDVDTRVKLKRSPVVLANTELTCAEVAWAAFIFQHFRGRINETNSNSCARSLPEIPANFKTHKTQGLDLC